MKVGEMKIPELLVRLLESGVWPSTPDAASTQNIQPIIGQSFAKKVSCDDDMIYLYCPPFRTAEEDCEQNSRFWRELLTNYGEIDYGKTIIIADFGLGSDSPIILNYEGSDEPRVMYLKWKIDASSNVSQKWVISHKWVVCGNTFAEFAERVGLS